MKMKFLEETKLRSGGCFGSTSLGVEFLTELFGNNDIHVFISDVCPKKGLVKTHQTKAATRRSSHNPPLSRTNIMARC